MEVILIPIVVVLADLSRGHQLEIPLLFVILVMELLLQVVIVLQVYQRHGMEILSSFANFIITDFEF